MKTKFDVELDKVYAIYVCDELRSIEEYTVQFIPTQVCRTYSFLIEELIRNNLTKSTL